MCLDIQYTPTLSISGKPEYDVDNVTVAVEWADDEDFTYTVRVYPMVPVMETGRSNCQLTIRYNTDYNLSVMAATSTPCRPNATAFIILNYGEVL